MGNAFGACLCCRLLMMGLWCWKVIDTAALHLLCCCEWPTVEVVSCCNINGQQMHCSYAPGYCTCGAIGLVCGR